MTWKGHCSIANNLGHVVVDDIYNCYAIYCLQSLNGNFEYGQLPKLILVQKENPLVGPLTCIEITIPNTVVTKLKHLITTKKGIY